MTEERAPYHVEQEPAKESHEHRDHSIPGAN